MSRVPRIRFKGFEEDWEQRKLEDFGKATGGTSIESEFSEDGIYKVISIGSYSENSVYNDQGIRAIKSGKTSNRVLNRNDLTMILNDKTTSGNIIGRVLLIEESGIYVYNQRTERIEIYLDEYDPVFLYEMLNAPNIREKIIKQAQGNTQIYVNWTAISLLEYMIPSKEEQVKIGEYLHSISNLITLHQRKLEKLKIIKKSMLENLFPQNGEKTPKIRFSGFTKDWEQCKAKELCNIDTGKSNTQDQVDDGIYPFYIRSDIPVNSNKYLYDCEAVITIGDGNIGRVFHYVNGKFDLHQRCYKMTDFQNVWGKYFYYFFSTRFYDRAMKMTAKATVDSVRLEMISEMNILKPTEINEQKKIAVFFTHLDHLITLHQSKLEKLQKIKNSMLESMFV